MSTNQIGLNENKSNELAKELNALLANYQMFYQNLRGFHWNIQGPSFFELQRYRCRVWTVPDPGAKNMIF